MRSVRMLLVVSPFAPPQWHDMAQRRFRAPTSTTSTVPTRKTKAAIVIINRRASALDKFPGQDPYVRSMGTIPKVRQRCHHNDESSTKKNISCNPQAI
eukprot:4026335-Amphidinium_carterae.1